jgi:hypothetical protein
MKTIPFFSSPPLPRGGDGGHKNRAGWRPLHRGRGRRGGRRWRRGAAGDAGDAGQGRRRRLEKKAPGIGSLFLEGDKVGAEDWEAVERSRRGGGRD